MGLSTSNTKIRMGIHNINDWVAAPGTLKFVAPEPGWTKVTGYKRIQRPHETGDGEQLHSLQGAQDTQLGNLAIRVRGLSGGGAGNGTSSSSSTKLDILYEMLNALCGVDASDASGELADAVDAGTGASLVLNAATSFIVGNPVLVKGPSGYQARWITAVSGDTATLCRGLTTDLGVAEDPTENEAVYAGAHWYLRGGTNNHPHLFADIEDSLDRWRLFGMLGNAQLRATAGEILHLVFPTLMGTKWDNDQSLASPTYSEPTAGNEVKVINCPVWIGSTLYMAHSIGFDFGLQTQPRPSDGAPNGHYGYVANKPFQAQLTMTLHYGSGTAPSEVSASTRNTFEGNDNRQDILVQFGRSPGECFALRMPDAHLEVSEASENGQKMLQVTARPSKPQGGSSAGELGGVQLAVF